MRGLSLEGVDEYYVRRGHDRERRTSETLCAFLEFTRSRALLGTEHLATTLFTNVLADPHRVITDSALPNRILGMKDVSRTNMRLHVLQLFKDEYGGLTKAGLDKHFDVKEPKSCMSRKPRVLSFLEASGDSIAVVSPLQKKRKLKAKAVKRVSGKKEAVLKAKNRLYETGDDQLASLAQKPSAVIRLRALRDTQWPLSEHAQAYRQTLGSHVPFHVQKNIFWLTVQECLKLLPTVHDMRL